MTYDSTVAPRYTPDDTIGPATTPSSTTRSTPGSTVAANTPRPGSNANTVAAYAATVATSFVSTHLCEGPHRVPNINTTPETIATAPNGNASADANASIAVPAANCTRASDVVNARTASTNRLNDNPSHATDEATCTTTKNRYTGRRSFLIPPSLAAPTAPAHHRTDVSTPTPPR
ncbi:hypothetical protein [Glycomyces paridis]|uniref:Uncharacterized protein n=1 Tax=Glycomyces paridis TaxID=2126555 RepID=A0A4S8P9C9_9ACTN|nr:hypothetical protein [Glycomyces paridis]THV26205.1 hypothetical protein E9998_19080 [Glycomyces paridis]